MLCLQLKAYPEIYEGYVPMAYSDYLKKMNKYYPYLNFYGFTLKALLKEFHAYTFFFLGGWNRSGEWGDHVTLQAAADSVWATT